MAVGLATNGDPSGGTVFTEDTHCVVYMNDEGSEPTKVIDGREGLTISAAIRPPSTSNGQSTIELDSDRATGESYCIAHHLFTDGGERQLMLAHLRYRDTFVKQDGAWLFAERNLYVDWIETRPRIRKCARWRPNSSLK